MNFQINNNILNMNKSDFQEELLKASGGSILGTKRQGSTRRRPKATTESVEGIAMPSSAFASAMGVQRDDISRKST